MGSLRMHTLNIEAARRHAADIGNTFGTTSAGVGTSTPYSLNTPDILNSLIQITSNPFFDSSSTTESNNTQSVVLPEHIEQEDKKVFATLEAPISTASKNIYSENSTIKTPSVPVLIPSSSPTIPSVQSIRSQFIKDSLKLTIQTKRKTNGKEELDIHADLIKVKKKEEVDSISNYSPSHTIFQKISKSIESANKLTPEDEERRRRRRERNKIAATKCRNKKKEKTGILVQESQTLETTNITLKSEISKLEDERQRLIEVLKSHSHNCIMGKISIQSSNLQRTVSSSMLYHQQSSILTDCVSSINDLSPSLTNNIYPNQLEHNLSNHTPQQQLTSSKLHSN